MALPIDLQVFLEDLGVCKSLGKDMQVFKDDSFQGGLICRRCLKWAQNASEFLPPCCQSRFRAFGVISQKILLYLGIRRMSKLHFIFYKNVCWLKHKETQNFL